MQRSLPFSFFSLTIIINSEWLAPISQNLIFTDVAISRRAVLIRGFDPEDLIVDPALVHGLDISCLIEAGRVFVHVYHRDVDWDARGKKSFKSSDSSESTNLYYILVLLVRVTRSFERGFFRALDTYLYAF